MMRERTFPSFSHRRRQKRRAASAAEIRLLQSSSGGRRGILSHEQLAIRRFYAAPLTPYSPPPSSNRLLGTGLRKRFSELRPTNPRPSNSNLQRGASLINCAPRKETCTYKVSTQARTTDSISNWRRRVCVSANCNPIVCRNVGVVFVLACTQPRDVVPRHPTPLFYGFD